MKPEVDADAHALSQSQPHMPVHGCALEYVSGVGAAGGLHIPKSGEGEEPLAARFQIPGQPVLSHPGPPPALQLP